MGAADTAVVATGAVGTSAVDMSAEVATSVEVECITVAECI